MWCWIRESSTAIRSRQMRCEEIAFCASPALDFSLTAKRNPAPTDICLPLPLAERTPCAGGEAGATGATGATGVAAGPAARGDLL